MRIALSEECKSCICERFRQRNSKSRRTRITQERWSPICSNRTLRLRRPFRNGQSTSYKSGPMRGWLYLGVAMDLYSRAIVEWSMNQRMTQQLVCDALTMALFRWRFPKSTILHSDHGSQYCSKRYQCLIKINGLRCSMGRTANCYDNAVTESFFHTLKVELVHRERYITRREAQSCIFQYIETYYNRQRRHSAIGYQIPIIFAGTA